MTTLRLNNGVTLGSVLVVWISCGALFVNVVAFSVGTRTRSMRVGQHIVVSGTLSKDENSALTVDEQHNNNEMTRYSSPVLWNDEEEDSWKEWHFSFSRNGFTDFLPQFSENLNCLLVGDVDNHKSHRRLPWDQHHQAKITARFLIQDNNDDEGSSHSQQNGGQKSASETNSDTDEELVAAHNADSVSELVATRIASMVHDDTADPLYDCILDRGLANAIISEDDVLGEEKLDALMNQASQAICYNGIYVMLTNHLLSTKTKEHLTRAGETLGMQWKFDLDGISSDGISVSVARKYFNGKLPSFGRLASVDRRSSPPSLGEGLAP